MKKIILVLILICLAVELYSEPRIYLTIQNRSINSGILYADVYANPPSSTDKWLVAASTIVIKFNSNGLNLTNLDGVAIQNLDSELSSAGYSCSQTDFGTGYLAMNLFVTNPTVNKFGDFRIGTIRFNVSSSSQYDSLKFDTDQCEIFNGLSLMLEYNCNTTSCYKVTNPTPMLLQSASVPTLTTTSISNITSTTASSGGNVTSDGGASVTSRGVCWSTSQNPTVSNSKTTDGSGTGSFNSSITGLSPNTTYYVRAYATNSVGTAYGSQVSFTTSQGATIPTVSTTSITNITTTTSSSGGNVTADGGASVTSRGVCWATTQNPTTANSKTTDGTGTGSFTSSITGLSANTTYYVRAYATNSVGTAYGSQVSFTTTAASAPTVTTTNISTITSNSASSGGNVTADGGASVTSRGVCWATTQNPTTANSKTTDGTGTGSFTSSITGLTANTTYYVRAYATNSVGTGYGEQKSFTTDTSSIIDVPNSWAFTDTTGSSSVIILPKSISPKIDNRDFQMGDAVGLFFSRNDSLICAGYAKWNNVNLAITVWGDNSETVIKDGYVANESYKFKIWDSQAGKELNAEFTFSIGNSYFTDDGLSILGTFKGISQVTQNVLLNSGWNLISSYITPVNDSLEVMFNSISSKLTILKNNGGSVYIPSYDINSIGKWDVTQGYKAYMSSSDTLKVKGLQIKPENKPLIINSGWNFVSYLRSSTKDISQCLTNLTESNTLVIAKNNGGSVYIPSYDINTIGNMEPGQGYQMYLNAKDTLVYPANGAGRTAPSVLTPMAKYILPEYKETGNSAVLLLEIEGTNGDEIAVYNTNNQVIGSGVIHKNNAAITIWGDNERTSEIDGAISSEKLKVKSYKVNTGRIVDVNLSELVEVVTGNNVNELNYSKDAFFVAKAKVLDNNSNLSMEVNPNPASDYIEITIEGDTDNTSLILFNNDGKQIADLSSELLTLSGNKLRYNTTNLSSGNYNLILNNGSDKIIKQLLIVK